MASQFGLIEKAIVAELKQMHSLKIEQDRLMLELATLTSHINVSRIARDSLKMKDVENEILLKIDR